MKRLREDAQQAVTAAIAAGSEPHAPKRARGLLLAVPGQRPRRLIDASGALTAVGEFYYDRIGEDAPGLGSFGDAAPERRRNSETVKLVDGRRALLRTWDPVKLAWKFTQTGRAYYRDKVTRYTVRFPTRELKTRKNDSVWVENSFIHSTALALGEIEVPLTMSEPEQQALVRQKANEYLAGLPNLDGDEVFIEGGGSETTVVFDKSRPLEFNREEVSTGEQPSVEAVMHRPLREARALDFRFAGVCAEAFEDSGGRCVTHQLAALQSDLGMADIELEMDQLHEELYPRNAPENPYRTLGDDGAVLYRGWRDAGVTISMLFEFCKTYNLAVHVLWGEDKIACLQPEHCASKLCLYVWGHHAFFVSDPATKRLITRMETTKPKLRPEVVLATRHKPDGPSADDWKDYYAGCPAGHYYSDDLEATRLELHRAGVSPRVVLSGVGVMKALRLKGKEDTVIHLRRPEAFVCEQFARAFSESTGRPLAYYGESLASFGNRALTALLRPAPRPSLAPEEKAEIKRRQGNRCNQCGVEAPLEIDHVVPRSQGGGDEASNLQGICEDCHSDKTGFERLSFVEEECPLTSTFSKETYEAVAKSKKPPPLVASLHEGDGPAPSIDIKRCRFAAYTQEDAYGLPIFSPVDEIRPAREGRLADLNWIDVGPLIGKGSARSVLPYHGPAWYGKESAAFLLDARIAKWSDFKRAIDASAHVPAKILADRLETLERIWLEVGGTFVGATWLEARGKRSPALLAKHASVAMIGMWGCTEQWRVRLETTSCGDDVAFEGARSIHDTPGSDTVDGVSIWKDIVTKQRVLTVATRGPINRHALEHERLDVARCLLYVARHVHPRNVCSLRVDEVIVTLPKRSPEKLIKGVEALRRKDLVGILPPGCAVKYQKASSSTAQVYRTTKLPEAIMPGGSLNDPPEAPAPDLPEKAWYVDVEPLDGPDTFQDRVVQRALGGESFCIEGPAGTGKTQVLLAVEVALKAQGRRVTKVCLTHVATRNLGSGALTAHCFVLRRIINGTFAGDDLIVDEISFMSLDLLACLEHLRLRGVRIICCGDWTQLGPVQNRWRGEPVQPMVFRDSALYHSWSGGVRFELTRCRRSDVAHFDACLAIRDMPLAEGLALVHQRYPPRAGEALWNIVVSHRRRRYVNEHHQRKAAAAQQGPTVPIDGEVSYDCFAGTRLVGCSNVLKKIVNGAFLLVTSVSEESIGLLDEQTSEEFEVTPAQLAKHTRLRSALTVWACQGRTLQGTIAIHESRSPHFSPTHLYVALTRTTSGAEIWLAH